jgi:hypothetical protein
VLQEAIDKKYFDERVAIPGPEGIKWARALAAKEGIFCGISSGATFAVAMKEAEKAAAGSVILAMLPDTGERYLTTPMFEGIVEDMDEEEKKISQSTRATRCRSRWASCSCRTAGLRGPLMSHERSSGSRSGRHERHGVGALRSDDHERRRRPAVRQDALTG